MRIVLQLNFDPDTPPAPPPPLEAVTPSGSPSLSPSSSSNGHGGTPAFQPCELLPTAGRAPWRELVSKCAPQRSPSKMAARRPRFPRRRERSGDAKNRSPLLFLLRWLLARPVPGLFTSTPGVWKSPPMVFLVSRIFDSVLWIMVAWECASRAWFRVGSARPRMTNFFWIFVIFFSRFFMLLMEEWSWLTKISMRSSEALPAHRIVEVWTLGGLFRFEVLWTTLTSGKIQVLRGDTRIVSCWVCEMNCFPCFSSGEKKGSRSIDGRKVQGQGTSQRETASKSPLGELFSCPLFFLFFHHTCSP